MHDRQQQVAVVVKAPADTTKTVNKTFTNTYLCALHIRNMPISRQIQPVGLVQLGACKHDNDPVLMGARVQCYQLADKAASSVSITQACDGR
jgi:hypothetical protein